MTTNRLALIPAKTEVLWITTPRRRNLLPLLPALQMDDLSIQPVHCVRVLGVLLDETLTLDHHITNLTRSCYYQLREIKRIRRYVSASTLIHLVRSFILTRLDYCNSILYGLPDVQLNRLQSVMNVAARLIFARRWKEHVTPLLRDNLHWLRIRERIIFKRCYLTFRALHDPSCPVYLTMLFVKSTTVERRTSLRSGNQSRLLVPPPAKAAGLGDRSASRGNPILWNGLPDSVTTVDSAAKFSKELKTYLFHRSYE